MARWTARRSHASGLSQIKAVPSHASYLDTVLMDVAVRRHDGPSRAHRLQRMDVFANISDEELEAYVNGDRGLEH
jgi:hypothetical protein